MLSHSPNATWSAEEDTRDGKTWELDARRSGDAAELPAAADGRAPPVRGRSEHTAGNGEYMASLTAQVRTEILEDGFLHAPDHVRGPRSDATDSHRIPVPGLAAPLQYFHVRVEPQREDARLDYVVVFEAALPLRSEIAAKLAVVVLEVKGSTLLLAARRGTGRASVRCERLDDQDRVASAVATVMASASWDQNDPVVVDVNERPRAVRLVFESGSWTSTVSAYPGAGRSV